MEISPKAKHILKITIYTLILGGIASLLHFAYDASNRSAFVGLFTPVSESIWEHLKLMYFPMLVFSAAAAFRKKTASALLAGAAAALTAPLIVLFFHYGCSGAIGMDIMFLDIFSVFLSYFLTLLIYYGILKIRRPNIYLTLILCVLAVIPAFLFMCFTFSPPELPLFTPPPVTK